MTFTWLNCFLLIIPILIWNMLFTSKLSQEGFKADHLVPSWIIWTEHGLRVLVFAGPLLLKLNWSSNYGALYIAGTLIYFMSWLPLLCFPKSEFSNSIVGILAPHVTPIVFLVAIGLMGESMSYIIASTLLILFHALDGLYSFQFIK